jgi:hypothetical protein
VGAYVSAVSAGEEFLCLFIAAMSSAAESCHIYSKL